MQYTVAYTTMVTHQTDVLQQNKKTHLVHNDFSIT
jgi:hypothetical protein